MTDHCEEVADTSPGPGAPPKKSVCYRCRKGIPRGQERSVRVWSVSNRQERVTICAPCAVAPQPTQAQPRTTR